MLTLDPSSETRRGTAAQSCGACHGPDLKGLGAVPGIAGRSPSYIVRQLYDFKHGTRAGADSAQMKPFRGEAVDPGHDFSCCLCGVIGTVARAAMNRMAVKLPFAALTARARR